MNAFLFAWRSLVRQPARTLLGVLGVAAVGALLFDMLMLSNGLVLSMQSMLGRTGFGIRVSASEQPMPGSGQTITEARATAAALRQVPGVAAAVPVRFGNGEVLRPVGPQSLAYVRLLGADDPEQRVWTMTAGPPLTGEALRGGVVVNRRLAAHLGRKVGEQVRLRASCGTAGTAAPAVLFRLAGIADFQFDDPDDVTAGIALEEFDRICGGEGGDVADQILVATAEGADDAAVRTALGRARPDLHAFTNAQVVAQLQAGGLSYFRQISLVLTTVTIAFAFLLVTVLLTVSVNQRVGEIAALRALGLSQRRVIADVLWESVLLVGSGALLAIPAGLVLARGLDSILKTIPGVPDELHFFVYQPQALWVHASLFAVTALLAAVYPMRLVASLPIAGTLRKEILG
jgi:putative ABC transport system permease protein